MRQDKDVLFEELRPFLHPQGIALIGASAHPEKLGYGVLRNLIHPEWGFPGPVYPVNPKAKEILGLPVYPTIADVPDPVDLALIIIPAPAVPQTVRACGERGIKGVIILSGGFKELGEEGERLQQEIVSIARQYGMRLIGPNCIGIMDTTIPLNTTFVRSQPLPGRVAFISQSGALCGTAIDLSQARGWGFSRMYSLGNQADVTETDFLQVLAQDEHTDVICLYVEEIRDGRTFYQVAREVTRHKPVLLLKAGRTDAGREAAQSHTGSLAGDVVAYRAACEDAGVQWCDSLQEMLESAMALAHNPPLPGRRIAVVTNAGGPSTLAADGLAEKGFQVAHVRPETQARLRQFLPPAAQVTSVVDMLGAAGPEQYRRTLEAVFEDPNVDGVLTIHVTQATVDPEALVQTLVEVKRAVRKPMVLSMPGQASVAQAWFKAHREGLPTVTYPEDAVRALWHLGRRAEIRSRPAEEPVRPPDIPKPRPWPMAGPLTDWDMRALASSYGIPLVPARLAHTPEEAAQHARELGFPVALKLLSPALLHKSDVGGVILNVSTVEEAERAAATLLARARAADPSAPIQGIEVQRMVPEGYEVIVGLVRDRSFGPLVMFGLGGMWVEVLKDVAFAMAPLDVHRARAMVERTRAARVLQGLRGRPPGDVDALVDVLVRWSWLGVDHPELAEAEINPLFVLPEGEGVLAVDMRGRVSGEE